MNFITIISHYLIINYKDIFKLYFNLFILKIHKNFLHSINYFITYKTLFIKL